MLIVIYGGYSCGNFGDELILQGTIKRIRAQLSNSGEIEFVIWPIYSVRAFVLHPYKEIGYQNLSELVQTLKRADLIVFGGGGLLQEYSPKDSLLRTVLRDVAFAHAFNPKLAMIGIGAGPLIQDSHLQLVKLGRLVPLFGVRDQTSFNLLTQASANSAVFNIGDSAFHVGLSAARANPSAGRLIGFAINPFFLYSGRGARDNDRQREIFVAFIKHLIETGYHIRLFVFQAGHEGDLGECQGIREALPDLRDKIAILNFVDCPDFVSLFAECSYVVGMRLHSMILCAILQTPLLPVPYHPKCRTFVQEAHLEDYAIDYEHLSLNELKAKNTKIMTDPELLRLRWLQTDWTTKTDAEQAFFGRVAALTQTPARVDWAAATVVLLKRAKWAAKSKFRRARLQLGAIAAHRRSHEQNPP